VITAPPRSSADGYGDLGLRTSRQRLAQWLRVPDADKAIAWLGAIEDARGTAGTVEKALYRHRHPLFGCSAPFRLLFDTTTLWFEGAVAFSPRACPWGRELGPIRPTPRTTTIAALEAEKIDFILGVRERTSHEVRAESIDDDGLAVPLVIPRQKVETELAVTQTTIAGRCYVIYRYEEEAKKDAAARAALERKLGL
jgi:hypothetical protein